VHPYGMCQACGCVSAVNGMGQACGCVSAVNRMGKACGCVSAVNGMGQACGCVSAFNVMGQACGCVSAVNSQWKLRSVPHTRAQAHTQRMLTHSRTHKRMMCVRVFGRAAHGRVQATARLPQAAAGLRRGAGDPWGPRPAQGTQACQQCQQQCQQQQQQQQHHHQR